MWVTRGSLGTRDAYSILKKYWDPRVGDNTRNMKCLRDGSGVVFDIRSDNFEAFMDNFVRLKETGDRIDFEIAKCTDLPDLEDEGGYGTNWRDQGRDNFRSNRGGGGGGYGGRGGYQDRGYGDSRGGGGYGGDRGYDNNRGYGGRGGDRDGGWGNKRGGDRDDYGGNDDGGSWRGQQNDSY